MHTPLAKKTVSIAQAAEASSLSKSTIRNLIKDGTLRAGHIRRRVIIQADSLDEMLENAARARVA